MVNINHIIYVKYWQDCNNKCSFCNQRLGTKVNNFGKFIKPSKESLIIHTDLLLQEYYSDPTQDVNIFLMGGELFHNANELELYEGFEYLANRLAEIKHTSFKVRIFSNLLYTDTRLILFFINKLKVLNINEEIVQLKTSYDLYGRFKSNAQVDLFVRNLKTIIDVRIPIQVKSVLTLDTLKNYNKDLYTIKTFLQIKDLPHTWCLERFKDEHNDTTDITNKFRIEKDLENFKLYYPEWYKNLENIEMLFADTKKQLLISYQYHTVNDVKFIIAGHTIKLAGKYEKN